ncbi:Ciliary Rootlet Coiled-Coil Protein 2-Like [Manis pentadactyla]|nr:Ciliary Rootlet Coiled-Coil Protein 2-Like [Manis pentadactyla]
MFLVYLGEALRSRRTAKSLIPRVECGGIVCTRHEIPVTVYPPAYKLRLAHIYHFPLFKPMGRSSVEALGEISTSQHRASGTEGTGKPSLQWPTPRPAGNACTLRCLTHPRPDNRQSHWLIKNQPI